MARVEVVDHQLNVQIKAWTSSEVARAAWRYRWRT
jgi:hypothetical protein